jgi:hypothetical protein
VYSQRNRDKQKVQIDELTNKKLRLEAEKTSLRELGHNYEKILKATKAENEMFRRRACYTRNTAQKNAVDSFIASASRNAPMPHSLLSIDHSRLSAERDYNQNAAAATRRIPAALGVGIYPLSRPTSNIGFSGAKSQNTAARGSALFGFQTFMFPPFTSNIVPSSRVQTQSQRVQQQGLSPQPQLRGNVSFRNSNPTSSTDSSLVASLRKKGDVGARSDNGK